MALTSLIPPDGESLERILDDVHTTQQQLDKDIETLKAWLKQQPHLPQNVLGDNMIGSFIIGCKNSLDKAKVKIDMYLTNRSQIPEIYRDRDHRSKEFLNFESVCQIFPLPRLTPEGYRVGIVRLIDNKLIKKQFPTLVKCSLINIDITMMTGYQGGYYGILDFKGYTMKHIFHVSPILMTKFISCIQDSMPVRIKGIFIFNVPSFAEGLVKMVRMMLKKDIRKRMHVFSGDHTNLYEYIPKEMLPNDYGGEAGTCDELQSAYYEFRESFRYWFMADSKITVDETKRPETSAYKPKQLYGVKGSFKTLNID